MKELFVLICTIVTLSLFTANAHENYICKNLQESGGYGHENIADP